MPVAARWGQPGQGIIALGAEEPQTLPAVAPGIPYSLVSIEKEKGELPALQVVGGCKPGLAGSYDEVRNVHAAKVAVGGPGRKTVAPRLVELIDNGVATRYKPLTTVKKKDGVPREVGDSVRSEQYANTQLVLG